MTERLPLEGERRPARRVLVADDDASIRDLLRIFLGERGYDVLEADNADEAERLVEARQPDLLLVDIRLPDASGLDLVKKVATAPSRLGAILMTAYGSANVAIQAMQLGAFDYVTKPFELAAVLMTVERYFEHQDLVAEVEALRTDLAGRDPLERIVGNSARMQDVYKMIGRVAASEATVLVWGETGTGKELVADAIHQHSGRRDGPLIKVNCAALPENLLESELFGHERGSFTGAMTQRRGRFELANHGTIFLDEIGELTLSTQRKLLRVLQEREFERVGSSTPVKADVRVIAATNKDLRQEVQHARFREDLYYRLNVISIELPPLRERRDDIPALVGHFVEKHRWDPAGPLSQVSAEAMARLLAHDWPGNVRELENTIERAVVTAQGGPVGPDELTFTPAGERRTVDITERLRKGMSHQDILAEVERHVLEQALDFAEGDHHRAAAALSLTRREFDRLLNTLKSTG
ncbi:MAG TPA: sigma-54 dependent transcriptional regulator [Chloroflexota bacterium]|nr:sigma-54 dependent transcriptional regulator [Chloroflexota bacterium]